jgi:hypothetical protein
MVLYAILQLKRWQAMEPGERSQLTGVQGLDAEKVGMGKWFCRLQNQSDRKTVLQFAMLISALYALVPLLFFFTSALVVVSALFTVYFLSLFEIGLCGFHYWRRTMHIRGFESRMGAWRADLIIFVAFQTKLSAPSMRVDSSLSARDFDSPVEDQNAAH